MGMKDTIHDYPIILSFTERHYVHSVDCLRVIMIARAGDPMPFVVAYHRGEESSWTNGGYYSTYDDAKAEFELRLSTLEGPYRAMEPPPHKRRAKE